MKKMHEWLLRNQTFAQCIVATLDRVEKLAVHDASCLRNVILILQWNITGDYVCALVMEQKLYLSSYSAN